QIAQAIRGNLSAAAPTSLPGVHVLNGAAESYGELFDPEEGGVKRAPKFPSSLGNRFLLRYWKRTGAEEARNMAPFSPTRMALGGIYDQVGGGFHRYSTDARWLVPHFERRLYANEPGNYEGSHVVSLSRVPDAEERAFLDRIRPVLREVRARRPPPLTDRKILTAWNGLMISAFARAGLAFARKDLVDRAARAADYLLSAHRPGGKLARSSMAGQSRHAGLLEDHAFLGAALVDLFEATGNARYLREARALHAEMSRSFADRENGGFFRTPIGHEELIAREKPGYDGAEPTGNSVAALTLLRLAEITGEESYRAEAGRLVPAFGTTLAGAPLILGEMLLAVDFALADTREVVLIRPALDADEALLEPLRRKFLPWQVLVRSAEGDAALARETPPARDRPPRAGRATAYVSH